MNTQLPSRFAGKPDWWKNRINFLLKGWNEPSEDTVETAYSAAYAKIPCTGSPGFRPCANCNELGFKCGDSDRPHYRSVKRSVQQHTVEAVIVYPDGKIVTIIYPLQRGDSIPVERVCSNCGMSSGYQGERMPCEHCERYGTFKNPEEEY